MPIYEYRCPSCLADFERLRPLSAADAPSECPTCHGPARRRPSTFASFSKGSTGELSAVGSSGSSCGGCAATSCATCR